MTRPSHTVHTRITSTDGKRVIWKTVGHAWTGVDGTLAVKLEALPVDGYMEIRAVR